ncbi:MAG TPA: nucleotidyltransferase family protein [Terracidiphilus sp.]|jgi:hypothetical protein
MNIGPIQIEWKQRARSLRLKETVFASFTEGAPSVRARLGEFTPGDWSRAKFWLDVSGLALYFLDRLTVLDLEECIPAFMLQQLRQDFADNRARTEMLLAEARAVNRTLRNLDVDFAFLKGITLPPESVTERALRSQMDIDILIREQDARLVQACLGEMGYELDAVSGYTWEFKAGPSGMSTLRNLYQVRPERALEVHLLPGAMEHQASDRLSRMDSNKNNAGKVASLGQADVFVLQAQHLFKHMCGEHTRVSWVLEYWRHVCARRDDANFWCEVERVAASENAAIAIGAATLLASLIFGPFAPATLTRWSVDRLSPAICLWIQLYGKRVLLSDTPGSKLYLLLRKQLNPHAGDEHRRLLFPIHLPQRITRARDREGVTQRFRRFKIQMLFSGRRLRFHLAEGLRLAVESPRWERRLTGVSE